MNEVFIDIRKENEWIRKHFENKDFVSIDDLVNCIENLILEIDNMKEKYEDEIETIKDNVKEWWC